MKGQATKMHDKLIFEVAVEIDSKQISQLKGPAGEVIMIPFGGAVKGELFNGRVLPGGVDTQTVNQNGVRHMSARYMLEGVDKNGEHCKIYIDNNGWFCGEMAGPFKAIPTFFTDSKTLAGYLHSNKFRTEGHPRQGGVTIKVFEIYDAL
jgi:hypothetical protein